MFEGVGMEKEYITMLEDEELQKAGKFNLTKNELFVDPVSDDIFYEEEELNFDWGNFFLHSVEDVWSSQLRKSANLSWLVEQELAPC